MLGVDGGTGGTGGAMCYSANPGTCGFSLFCLGQCLDYVWVIWTRMRARVRACVRETASDVDEGWMEDAHGDDDGRKMNGKWMWMEMKIKMES